jgi:glycosyltransferase involved in cell wall biosynthesis
MPEPRPTRVKVSVSMLTMNEEGAIAKVVADLRAVVPEAEILIVDSSSDRTPEIAASLGCRVVRQFPPRGYGPAMDHALRDASGDIVVTLDCDDTYPTHMIPEFVKAIDDGADMVDGNRVWRRPPAMPLANFVANRAFGLIARVACGSKAMDLHSGMRAYRRSMLEALRWDPKGAALPVELVLLPERLGYRVVHIPIDYHERIGRTTLDPVDSTLWTLKRIWRVARQPKVAG